MTTQTITEVQAREFEDIFGTSRGLKGDMARLRAQTDRTSGLRECRLEVSKLAARFKSEHEQATAEISETIFYKARDAFKKTETSVSCNPTAMLIDDTLRMLDELGGLSVDEVIIKISHSDLDMRIYHVSILELSLGTVRYGRQASGEFRWQTVLNSYLTGLYKHTMGDASATLMQEPRIHTSEQKALGPDKSQVLAALAWSREIHFAALKARLSRETPLEIHFEEEDCRVKL